MFTEGLDGSALKWVRQNSYRFYMNLYQKGGPKKEIFSPVLNRGIGLPYQFNYQTGHLASGVDPVKTIPVNGDDDSGSGSDMDISPDSDDEVYGGKYSVKSSKDDKISNGAASAYTSDSYSSSSTSWSNIETTAKKEYCDRLVRNQKLSYTDIPSAPPFVGRGLGIKQVVEQSSTFRAQDTPCLAKSSGHATTNNPKPTSNIHSGISFQDSAGYKTPDLFTGNAAGIEVDTSTNSLPARLPTFHASGLGPWCSMISYDACVRLCLHSWATGCGEEVPYFLNNECALLRNAFGLQQILLQSEEELLAKKTAELVSEGATLKPKKTYGKMKVHVRKVKLGLEPPPGCNFSSLKPSMVKVESVRRHFSNLNSMLNSGWEAIRRVPLTPRPPANGSFSQQSLAYLHASTRYIKEVSKLLRNEITTSCKHSSTCEVVQETYSCFLRTKSMSEEDVVRMQPGSGETHVFFPDSIGDDLIVEVQGSKGKCYGRVLAQMAAIAEDPSDKLRWWPIYHEPEHELIGRIQLYINYSTTQVDNNLKCGCVAETVAYDLVLENAMKAQNFQQRNLLLKGPWKWLLDNFASYYGVSDAYTKLRYLSYIMDVATPTRDCIALVYDLLLPVLMKGNSKSVLSHQENRILGEVDDQAQHILALVFENYKSLDELLASGLMDVFGPATGLAPPALAPAVELYNLLHDILSPEAQLKFTRYFQAAVKKRSRRHLAETDEFVSSNNDGTLTNPLTLSTAYQKMKSLILSVRNEIYTDIEIHNQHVLPSFLDLPNLSACIYNVDLCNRLRGFLVSCPPSGPSPPVAELVIATVDFQRDLCSWSITPVKGGVDAKELFHSYITRWIQDKRLALLESCKLEKVKWSGVRTKHSTAPFIDEMHDRLKEMLNEYEIIIRHWPEYATVLENAVADIERATVETLDKQYTDVLSPLKDNLTTKILGLKYVQKIAKGTVNAYCVPDELGILLNSMKRMLDTLWPQIETQFKSWSSWIAECRNAVAGEHLSEITVMMRAKFRNYLLAVVEKLVENTRMQSTTKLKKIIQDSKETCVESDVQSRMQPLKDLLIKTVDHLHTVVEPNVFVLICRFFWDQMGQDVLHFLESKRENSSWYKSSRIAVSILDEIFASQMQQLLGNAVQEKDLEPPRSIKEVRSMLCKDSVNYKDDNYYV